ncbi:hypothetical protein [Demequina globuliformis]|uniref:hypothetical protein n=1 Tax=Demequina globuliformis TaxID=676202 RepID=UPI0007808CBA|nr:hypothetical protein [Demequina globuliformis]
MTSRAGGVASLSVACAVTTIALVGCTTSPEATPHAESSDEGFAAIVESAVRDAVDSGASPAQLALLEDAREAGEVTYEAAARARDATVACLTELGLDARAEDHENEWGYVLPFWSVAADSSAPVDTCENQESMWISQVYQTQPAALSARDVWIQERSPQLRACLSEQGVDLDPDTTVAELLSATSDLWNETEGSIDCAGEIGLHSY